MTISNSTTNVPAPAEAAGRQPIAVTGRSAAGSVRIWPALLIVALFWVFSIVARELELVTFVRFLSSMAASAVVVLAFAIWWLANRRISRAQRLGGLAVVLFGGIAAGFLCDKSIGVFGLLMFALPCVLTIAALWLLVAKRVAAVRPRAVGIGLVLLTWGFFTLIRTDGISGEQRAANHWRWTPTAEELFLADRAKTRATATEGPRTADDESAEHDPLHVQPDDWPGFRGPVRDGIVSGVTIGTDWNAAPPKQVWKQRVGPAWSSVVVVGDRLFTQEQRGDLETVVCLDAATGREIWAHEDSARFWDGVAGAGPRATPTFADGRIYALGATGLLNCLDALSGRPIWSRDIAAESGAKAPGWGFSGSPLVTNGLAVVFAGGENGKGLLAYRGDTGEPAWTAAAGQVSYSSPQLTSIAGQPLILAVSDGGLVAVDPDSGAERWTYGSPTPGAPVSIQPHRLGDSQVLVPSPGEFGLALIDVARDGGSWAPSKRWASGAVHPSFNDFVVSDGCAFGFSEAIFACLDIETGKRRWKKGRYGYGQVLLLADQKLLLVLAESGEVVLLAANPERHAELSRFQAIEGKSWNHPAIAHGRLYVRNAEQIACYELPAP